ncbi:hypothetical protein GOV03_00170 [Candidatus Woesearchaeota archaeon]|nr:hypothetical protein [Candidatus Woesearchaeota archaeon]
MKKRLLLIVSIIFLALFTNPGLKKHIHHHLKKGRHYSAVRKDLIKAGWQEEHVDSAYKKVLTHRYKKYQETNASPVNVNRKKMIIIAVVSTILVISALFLLSSVIGKAIQTQSNFAHNEPFICTPPHIVTEGGCCLDNNNNGVCDIDEEYEKGRVAVSADVCHDHRDCAAGEVCIDSKCNVLSNLYRTDCPKQDKCNINQIEIFTSDNEMYTLHAKKGSYTAAGALAWTIRPVPNYCQGEEIVVPIEIEKTDLVCYIGLSKTDELKQEISCDQGTEITCKTNEDCTACFDLYGVPCYCHNSDSEGICVKDRIDDIDVKVVSKEIITLRIGQTSAVMTHPNPKVNEALKGFTLTLKDVNELCFPS